VGQLIMLGTLFGLIILIFGFVWYFDPEARGPRTSADTTPESDQ
jgi:zona occludens toxin (predicted ATPase)